MGDHGNMDDLTAALALIQQQMQTQQQQMLQMQQTIQNQQQAAQEQAAVNAAREEREATPEKSAGDLAFEAELSGDDQQEVSYVNGQGWQLKNYHPNPNVRNNQQLFWLHFTSFYRWHALSNQPREYETCTSSTAPPQAQQQTSATYPWPREQEGKPIDLDIPLLLDFNCDRWDKGTAARYNALLRVDMLPTCFCHAETLADLGIDEDVFEMLHAIGIAPLCYTTHELYPDLARHRHDHVRGF
ncbi:hypothetical protein F2Q69_00014612 [Brassica cretica]|uniref:Uncharacterized protein n=1 Tax=Brassica cretica TaxID=69181 RepID=A0A8S9QLS3_BRACR|nr:hypothetical protein F2Q69_00014612 [Brassica cretica]